MPGENGYNVALYLTKWASEWIVMCFCDKWRRDVTSGHVTHSRAIDTLMPTRAQVWIVLTCRTDSVERALTLHFRRKVDTAVAGRVFIWSRITHILLVRCANSICTKEYCKLRKLNNKYTVYMKHQNIKTPKHLTCFKN